MDPGTALLMATIAQVGGQVMQGVEGYQQGKYEAAVAEQNAGIAEENAARARLDAALAEEAKRREVRKALGRAAAAGSQAGIGGPGQGSLGASLTQSAKEGELDALNIRYGGESEAYANLTQAAQFRSERKMALQRARGAIVSGVFGAASAGLSGHANYRTAQAQQRYSQPRLTTTKAPVASAGRK